MRSGCLVSMQEEYKRFWEGKMLAKQKRREMDHLVRKAIDIRSALINGLDARAAYVMGVRDGFRLGRMSYNKLINLFDASGNLDSNVLEVKKRMNQLISTPSCSP